MKLIIAISIGLLFFVLLFPTQFFKQRGALGRFNEKKKKLTNDNIENKVLRQLVKLARKLRRIINIKILPEKRFQIKEKLDYANMSKMISPEDFVYLKVIITGITGLYFGFHYYHSKDMLTLICLILGSVMGYLVPNQWLDGKVKKRKLAIRKSVPYVLSLFSILMEAGLNITQAMEEIAKNPNNALAVEIQITTEEMHLGLTNAEALENMALRTNVDEVNYFVSSMIQGLEKGNSGIAKIVKEHAENSWNIRKSLAKELAEKASMKLFLPLLLLVFPAMVIFLLGPMIFSMIDMFSQGV
ncbi:type II secretion system F family protein [Fusibacter sp. 3D3]|uniref:type II secretion system F family protein n=1 Tax=Fusibacter sp. 3D3 TaxID=1048380 RepID=UPI000852D519|nr:type II secretion system F family protein [Fusibacter sp. 3D3]GAU76349.1 type II/IV secretion system protein TadC [Fusibacter sp. 3D3]